MDKPRVKPLVWDKGIVDWATPLPGMKYVASSTSPKTHWVWWLEGDESIGMREVHPSEEAAKAAAQSDYEARILAALEPAPVSVDPLLIKGIVDDCCITDGNGNITNFDYGDFESRFYCALAEKGEA